ncbi:hypothetical protein PVOR_26578 [Paenibacillus vortex V453]|uniref:Uncharacterized protein n=1 Tax=Paenibacillus vortex V453 TaxID=715225 RepID=A0A2R9SP79_9BACL|nr:hypothetical protein PVOR_26578 [Paenibacillus vortex V453]
MRIVNIDVGVLLAFLDFAADPGEGFILPVWNPVVYNLGQRTEPLLPGIVALQCIALDRTRV